MNTPNPNMASESTTSAARKAVVVGAGPVGCLSAIALAKMGWNVEIYEGRPDMRLPSSKAEAQLRSINLAMSARGIAATKVISPAAADRFLKAVVPMHARMIHYVTGQQESQPYDRYGECINSIDRSYMNECLLEDAIVIPNVRVLFNHKVVSIDFDSRKMVVQDAASGQNTRVSFSLCVGADGSYSIVRRQLMRVVRMNYQQEYIPHEYLELRMPAGPADITGEPTFLLDPNHLHIWPRHTFMLVALPNQDKTFTCTVFAPTAEFDRLDTPEVIIKWFKTYFSDALHLIGEDALLHDFHRNPRSPLMVVKATPYHFKDRAIILGDAAHAMVPFYGQGLNCGLEDVRVLDILLRSERVDPDYQVPEGTEDVQLANALRKYTESRHEDLVAICDLAMANYVEMRHDVITPAYLFRKALDNVLYAISSTHVTLNSLIPVLSRVPFSPNPSTGWLPQYTMVTFRPDISYSTVKRLASKQKRILEYTGWASAAVGVGLASITCVTGLRRFWNRG